MAKTNIEEAKIKIFNDSNNPNPVYHQDGDTGCDVQASMQHTKEKYDAGLGQDWFYDEATNTAIIQPGGRALIGTGLFCEIPLGYGIAIRPRSGLALKKGITVCNTPGTIDSGYRSEIGVILINHSKEDFIVSEGDRIAQFVLEKILTISWQQVSSRKDLQQSKRGQGGYGSTGK